MYEMGLDIDPRSGYGTQDVIRLFLLIRDAPAGRVKIMRRLLLGEATVKTMLKFLKGRGLITQGTKGVAPSVKGALEFSFCTRLAGPRNVRIGGFSEGPTVYVVVKEAAGNVRSGIEQRDEGVRQGASIVTLVMTGDALVLPGVRGSAEDYLKGAAFPEAGEGDVVMVSSAPTRPEAERGAVAAATSVL